ncbi:MAG: RNA polymerase sigma factor [Acidimicrobiales bacterium]
MVDDDEITLEELARRAQGGERAAAEALLRRTRPWIERSVGQTQYEYADVQDIAQLALIKILASLGSYDPNRSFKAWAKSVIRSAHISYLRARRPRSAAEDRWSELESRSQETGPEAAAQVEFAIAFRACSASLQSELRRRLAWSHLMDGVPIADLEREHPAYRHSIRRWLKLDLQSLYRCLYDKLPRLQGTKP